MKKSLGLVLLVLSIFLAGCQEEAKCPLGTLSYLSPPFSPEDDGSIPQPEIVKIGRREIQMDEVISGELCNDSWSGTIYVTCNIQIPSWEGEEAPFLKECDLTVEEGSVVYVEAHANQPYYQGCTCHE